jgi:hypothetical protein
MLAENHDQSVAEPEDAEQRSWGSVLDTYRESASFELERQNSVISRLLLCVHLDQ